MGAEAAMSNAPGRSEPAERSKERFHRYLCSTTAHCFDLRTTLRILKTDELMKYRPRRSVEPRGSCCDVLIIPWEKIYPEVRPNL